MTINSFHCNLRPIGKITLLVLILFTSAWKAWALNVFEGWDKAPTFTPPSGCIPSVQNYGVTAKCDMTLKPGRRFVVSIDAARGALVNVVRAPTKKDDEVFVNDHVVEIKQYWEEFVRNHNPGSSLTFSSRASTVIPSNTPRNLTTCKEYSIGLEITESIEGKDVPVQWRTEGLTCGWVVENSKDGLNLELFWLEVFDTHSKALRQEPTARLESIVRDVFASARI